MTIEAAVHGTEALLAVRKKKRAQESAERRAASEALHRKEALQHFLTHMTSGYARPLRELLAAGTKTYLRGGELIKLESLGAIEQIVETESSNSVYRLTPFAAPIIRQHFEETRRRHVEAAVTRLEAADFEFLMLFGVPQSVFEDPSGTELMPYEVFRAGENLTHSGLLRRVDTGDQDFSTWSIVSDAEEAIVRIHGLKLVRQELRVALNRVASGGGAGGMPWPPQFGS